jgi:cell division protein FtsQ
MAKPSKGATRRVAEERKPLPRWPLAVLAIAAAVAVLGWSLGQLVDPASLPLTTIRIESPLKQLTQEDIRNAVRPHVKEGFMAVDVDEIRKELEALPWVAGASVRREWPDILVVRVAEQQPVARWSNGGLLNGQGEVFVPTDTQVWNSLPLLRGPAESEKVMTKEYQALQVMLAPLGLRISHLTMNERRSWSLVLQDGLQLRLGRRDMHTRLLRFVRVFAQVLKPKLEKIDSVDLRYTNGFAVRWRDGTHATA